MTIYHNITELVGHTPVVELAKFAREQGANARIFAKLEAYNPTGSMKDRVALAMIRQAEADGKLAPGGTIIEPTSGNTGIGLAAIGAYLGYRVIIVMPDSMTVERRKLMQIYGAELVLTPGAQGMSGAIAKADALAREIPGAIVAGQFENPANPQSIPPVQNSGSRWKDRSTFSLPASAPAAASVAQGAISRIRTQRSKLLPSSQPALPCSVVVRLVHTPSRALAQGSCQKPSIPRSTTRSFL